MTYTEQAVDSDTRVSAAFYDVVEISAYIESSKLSTSSSFKQYFLKYCKDKRYVFFF